MIGGRTDTAAVDVTVRHQSVELGQTVSESRRLTVPVHLAYDVPTKVSFVAAGYDADGRMLCTIMKTLTVSGETNTVSLPLPKNIAADSAAIWRVMALDAGSLFPLGQAA